MDAILLALNDINQTQIVKEKQSIGLIHQKMQDRYKVVKVLPKEADSFDNVFNYADAYGKIRFGYFSSKLKSDSTQDSFASAIGGILGIKTAEYYGVSLNAAAYISQDVPLYDEDKQNLDFYTTNGDSYTYLAEASINYHNDFLEAKIGRIAIDMPYANTDDLRMSQNTFEGAWANIELPANFSSSIFYLQRWAGFDSQDEDAGLNQNEFKDLVDGSRGMIGASLAYRYNKESELSFWYQNIEYMADIYYGELNGVYDFNDDYHLDYGLQYSHIAEDKNSNIDGDVWGVMAIGHYRDFFISGAFNQALVDEGKSVTDGFGGGPYFTSLDEWTIAAASEYAPSEDVDFYRGGIGYDATNIYSSFEYAYGLMDIASAKIKEHDFIYTFNKDEKIVVQAVLMYYEIDGGELDGEKLNRAVVRLDYNF